MTLNFTYLTLALEVISDSRNGEQVQFKRRSGSRRFRFDRESDRGIREHNSSVSNRAFLGQLNNPSSVKRFQGRHRSLQGTL